MDIEKILIQLKEAKESNDHKKITELKDLLEAEMSHDDIRRNLRQALKEEDKNAWYYIQDVFSSYLVYEKEPRSNNEMMVEIPSKLYKRTYVIDENQKVTFGDPSEVVVETIYKTVTEAEQEPIKDDYVPLKEAKVRRDNTIPVKIIEPGWGNSGYYSKEVLERDAGVYKAGTKMYWNHPTLTEEVERPERDLRDLAAILESDGKWDDNGPEGAGVYADAKVLSGYKESIEELAPHIGLSHKALGKAKMGEAEGRKGPIIDQIVIAKSVDFVTDPGAGGKVVQLFEAAREKARNSIVGLDWKAIKLEEVKKNRPDLVEEMRKEIKTAVYGEKGNFETKLEEVKRMNEQELKELKESKQTLEDENRRLKEGNILRQAKDYVISELKEAKIPDITKARLVESLSVNPTIKDGELDKEGFKVKIKEALDAEIDYLAKVTGSGDVKGLGESGGGNPSEVNATELEKNLEESFGRLGLSESARKTAAKGREV